MTEVQRIYPEAKSALINWIEENFHNIDSYVFTCILDDGTTMTVHHIRSYLEGLGLCEIAKDTMSVASMNGELKLREDSEK